VHPRQAGINARDAGLELIGRVNRWMIAGAVAASGLVSLVASQSFHGRTVSSGTASGASSSQSSSSSSGSSSNSGSTSSAGGTAIQQPAQPPSTASPVGSAPVVSGGS